MSFARRKNFKVRIAFSLGIIVGIFLVSLLANVVGFFVPQEVWAISFDEGLGATLGLGTADLLETVINIIQWILGLLALIAVIIIIYGGIIWMTAAGNEEKVKKAKKILINGLIGLAIILLAWAIVFFVMRVINNSTNGGGGGGSCGGGPPCSPPEICCPGGYCSTDCGGGFSNYFEITGFEYSGMARDDINLCSKIKIKFNTNVNSTTVEDAENSSPATLYIDPSVEPDEDFITSSRDVTYEHDNVLFDDFQNYQLNIPQSIEDTGGRELDGCQGTIPGCNDAGDPVTWDFATQDHLDEQAPNIVTAIPLFSTQSGYPSRNISIAPIIQVTFDEPIDDRTIMDGTPLRPIDGNFELMRFTDLPADLGGTGVADVALPNGDLLAGPSSNGFLVQLDPAIGYYLEPFTWYRITVQNVEDLCSNLMSGPEVWYFETNDTAPGVSYVSPPDSFQYACPDTKIEIGYNTSMYDVSNGQCYVHPTDGGYVTDGILNPAVSGRNLQVVDNYPGFGDPNDYCKRYAFNPETAQLQTNSDYQVGVNSRLIINIDGSTLNYGDLGRTPSAGPWSFHVTEPGSCAYPPVITNLSPNSGPDGQCFTIQGYYFDPEANGQNPGDTITFDSNPISPLSWSDINIPTTAPNVDESVSYPVQVNIDWGGMIGVIPSNIKDFYGRDGTSTGPCLWDIDPEEGFEGDGVHLIGTRFGSAPGEVTFGGGVNPSGYGSWNDTDINTDVPAGAITGDVTVTETGGQTSNGLLFTVHQYPPDTPYVINDSYCSDGPPAVYASPSPRINQQNICLNAVASARFSESMNPTTLNNNNIYIQKCTDPGSNPCNTKDPPLGGTIIVSDYSYTDDMFTLDPPADLDPDFWYEATITTGVQNLGGIGMANNFVWRFKTKVDTGPCPVSGVGVNPPGPITINWGGSQVYDSVPTGPDCQIFGPNDYTWEWDSTTPNVADIVGSPTGPQATASSSNIQEGYTWIQASTEGRTGQSRLNVDLTTCEADPTLCTDTTRGGCAGSQCISGTCTPIIENISPISGPIGQYVTVDGCWFGAYDPAVSKVEFLGPPVVQARWPEACGPDGSTWANNSITVEVPEDETPPGDDAQDGPMRVTVQGGNSDATNDGNGPSVSDYDVTSGVAVNLCPLNPSSGRNNTPFTATGEGFGTQGGGDNISFLDDVGGRVAAPISTWIATQIEGTVPATAITSQPPDGVYVTADGNTSNQQPFIVSCSTNSDCVTGCCYGNQCRDAAYCSTGGPGQECRIPSNDDCSIGPLNFPGGYDCFSDTGDTESKTPPPPPPWPDPSYGADCRVCCEPGQVYNSLTCTEDQGDCTGTERGLYCGCTTDPQCGNQATIGCGETNPRCCYERPNVESTDPSAGETGVCLNSLITVTFDRLMDSSSFAGNFEVVDTALVPVPGSISSYNQGGKTVLVFTPTSNLQTSEQYRVTITGDGDINDGTAAGVRSIYQVGMNGNEQYGFTTSTELCQIDRVEVNVMPPGEVRNFDLYTCSNDTGCANDQDIVVDGNQHLYTALALADDGTQIGASYSWNDPSGNGILKVENTTSNSTDVSTLGPNGQENIQVTADAGDQGEASTIVVARVDACDNPWPTTPPYVFEDQVPMDTNFLTYYCMDGGLPTMMDPIVTKDYSPSDPNVDELIKEFFFSPDDGSGDVIGIRVMENQGFLSARAWFNNMFPEDSGTGGSGRLVDGYEALQVGRTVYVAATNLSGGTLYPNIYLISYNNNAQSNTANIYNQLIDNWYFNTNVTGNCASEPNKQCIIRDTKRVTNLGEIAFELLQYEESNGNFPPLTAGSYLEGTTTSRWPSWTSQLGNILGTTLPIDPKNVFDPTCPTGPPDYYDPAGTCWSDTSKKYTCPADSHIYQYSTFNSGRNVYLYANLEYAGTGNWRSTPPMGQDPCGPLSGDSSCACFNYQIDDSDSFGVHPYWTN